MPDGLGYSSSGRSKSPPHNSLENSRSVSRASPTRRIEVELSSGSWRQGRVGRMGGSNSTSNNGGGVGGGRMTAGYEVVDREEPLLDEDNGGTTHEDNGRGERDAQGDTSREGVSAGLLWNDGDGASLRSDATLGPAFGQRRNGFGGGKNGRQSPSWGVDGGRDDGVVVEGGRRRREGCCSVSGRPLVYLCALCSSLCSILLGYDVGVMSGAKEYITPDLKLTEVEEEVIVGSLNIVAAFGGLLAGKAADRLGRKPTIALACLVFILGASIMSASYTFRLLLLGRIITGIGVGCAMVIAPVYITELAPPDVRGMLVSLTDICINVGIVFGYASSLLCSDVFHTDSARWRAMLGIGCLPPALILLCLTMMPESPRWLIARGRNPEALDVLQRVSGDDREAETSLRTISDATASHEEASWMDVLVPRDRVVRAAMVLGLGLGFWQQASGSEAAVYYTPEVMANTGWKKQTEILKGNIGVGGFKLAGEIVAFVLLDRIGRRPLFLGSAFLVTICLAMIGNAFIFHWGSLATLGWLCMFMFTFSLGLGPVTFVVASEIFPLAVRGKAMSLVICINRLMSGIIALSYQSLSDALTPGGSFYLFALVSATSIYFYWYKVPETRQRTLEEIAAELASSSPPAARGMTNGRRSGEIRHVPLTNEDEEDELAAEEDHSEAAQNAGAGGERNVLGNV